MKKVQDPHAADLAQLQAQYGEIHTIEGTDAAGNLLISYLRNPTYETKKLLYLTASKNPDDMVAIGELVLSTCTVGGVELYAHAECGVEAAIRAALIPKFNSTFSLKKN